MTDAFIRILDKLIDLATEQIWTAPVCITSGALLVFYQYQINAFGIYGFLSSNKTILAFILIVFITSLSFIFCTLLLKAVNLLSKKYAKRQLMQVSYDRLRRYLTEQQKDMLQKMVNAPDNSYYIPNSAHIEQLEHFNIVWSSNITEKESYRVLEEYKFRYTLKPWALSFLQKHPDLIKIKQAKLTGEFNSLE